MTAVNITAGTKVHIGPVVPDPSAATVLTIDDGPFTEIKNLMDLGEIGDTANDVPVSLISEKRVLHMPGQFDGGTVDWVFARAWTDPGQVAAFTAFRARTNNAFKIERAGAGGKVSYFVGTVMGAKESYSSADNVQQATYTIAINSDLFTVADA